jgi:ubiquitin C-terminal hydrolase
MDETSDQVIRKYEEIKDYDGGSILEFSNQLWTKILTRNGSFLANLFLGQFLTRVICPDCNYESVTCEPFNSIPLDLEKDA